MDSFRLKELCSQVTNLGISITTLARLADDISAFGLKSDRFVNKPSFELSVCWEQTLMICHSALGIFPASLKYSDTPSDSFALSSWLSAYRVECGPMSYYSISRCLR